MLNNLYFFTFTFSYTFQYDEDEVYFAHSFPYSFQDLNRYLHYLANKQDFSNYLRMNTLCYSLAGTYHSN